MRKPARDVERFYATEEVVAKLRRLADALETTQHVGSRSRANPSGCQKRAEFSIEHERGDTEEEIEFQLTWTLDPSDNVEASEDAPVV